MGFWKRVNLTKMTYPKLLESVGWRPDFSLLFLILLFTKPNIEGIGWLYQTKTHITHIVYCLSTFFKSDASYN